MDYLGTLNLIEAAKGQGAAKFVLLTSLLTNAVAVGQVSLIGPRDCKGRIAYQSTVDDGHHQSPRRQAQGGSVAYPLHPLPTN